MRSGELVADLKEDIRDKLKPPIPPHASPVTIGASQHRVQANHLVAGLTHTLAGLRGRAMATPSAVSRAPLCQERHNHPTAMWRIPLVLSWTGSS